MMFSILMSVYNEEKLIASALENAIKQIYKYGVNAEILIGIDGDDRTEEIARSYIKKFPKLRVYKFAKRKGRTKTMNFLIDKARGEILINHDPDRLLKVNLHKVEKVFENRRIGALIAVDTMDRDSINDGQKLFEDTYMQIKLSKYLRRNVATKPVFQAYIYRKSALKKPYFETTQDDSEVVYKLMKAGYNVVYLRDVATPLPDNPKMPRLTPSDIIKRRVRAELFRSHAKVILRTESYSGKSHLKDFALAIFITLTKCNVSQFLGFIEYLLIVCIAIFMARLRLVVEKEFDGWKMKYRVSR
jgi:glycosyltransferase involved in cell wall biosynthesis